MSRSISWRRVCPDFVNTRIEEAYEKVVYIVHQTGPTGFVLKQEGEEKKFKVLLGDPHTCTCSVFRKENELCIHILWLLLKKFRIPKTNPIIFQLGLIEREIHEIICGILTRQSPKQTDSSESENTAATNQRPISTDDICPICQDDLLKKPQKLAFCKYGCGQSVHLKCIKEWAEHQKSRGEVVVACPLCREKFCSFEELKHLQKINAKQSNKGMKELSHFGVTCNHCEVCPISGKCYKCISCPCFFLCHVCFEENHHLIHSFQVQHNPGHPWRPTTRHISSSSIPQSIIDDIQMRELTENDYETLLQLDCPPRPKALIIPTYVINSFRSEPLDHNHPLLKSRMSCLICNDHFHRGDWIRKMPCKHKFHRECIDNWLMSDGQDGGHVTCPIDGKTLYDPDKRKGTCKTGQLDCKTQQISPIKEIVDMSISGHGIGNKRELNEPRCHVPYLNQPTVMKGSAISKQTNSHPLPAAYININTTSLNNATPTAKLSYNKKRSSYPFQPLSHYTRLTKAQTKLPKIAERESNNMESFLHVSSLKTALPPINADKFNDT